MPIRQLAVSGLPAVSLRAGDVEVIAVPSLGCRVTNLRRARGREWLWRSDRVPLRAAAPAARYASQGDAGGWDECFPTTAPSPVPHDPAVPPLPDHGELWTAAWRTDAFEHDGRVTLHGEARSERLPLAFTRELTLFPDAPLVRAAYVVRHTGEGGPVAWQWAAHVALSAPPGMVLEAPGLRQVRIDHAPGRDDVAAEDLVTWRGALADAAGRFVMPEEGSWAVKCAGDVAGAAAVTLIAPQREERLVLRLDGAMTPQLGLLLDAGRERRADLSPDRRLVLMPAIGAADALARSVELGVAATLAPGEARRFAFELELPD